MKKTIVALAVAAVAATSANAATVYNQDGTKVEVNGSVRVQLHKAKGLRSDLEDKGSRLVVKASHDLGNGLSALANVEVRLSGKDKYYELDSQGKLVEKEKKRAGFGNKIDARRLYAGFAYEGVGTLTFGKQLTVGDDVGFGNYTYELGGINKLVGSGDKVVNFKSANFNGFSFGAAYVFDEDPTRRNADNTVNVNERSYVLGAFYKGKFGDFGVGVETGYSHTRVTHEKSKKAFGVATELSYNPVAFGVDYFNTKEDKKKVDAVLFGLKYQVTDMAKLYTTYETEKTRNMGKTTERKHAFALGVGYKLHKQVETYLEGEKSTTKKYANNKVTSDKGHRVNLGFRVHF